MPDSLDNVNKSNTVIAPAFLPVLARLHLWLECPLLELLHIQHGTRVCKPSKRHKIQHCQIDITTDMELFCTGEADWDEPRFCWLADITYICICGLSFHSKPSQSKHIFNDATAAQASAQAWFSLFQHRYLDPTKISCSINLCEEGDNV